MSYKGRRRETKPTAAMSLNVTAVFLSGNVKSVHRWLADKSRKNEFLQDTIYFMSACCLSRGAEVMKQYKCHCSAPPI